MSAFFEILQNLRNLDLIIRINQDFNKIDMRSVVVYSASEEDNEIIVSQTKPPINKDIIGHEIEASFVVDLKNNKEPERFFFPAIIKSIGLFTLTRSRFVEAIFLRPVHKKIYRRSLRLHPRIECKKDYPIYVEIIPGNDRFSVIDISEGGLCFSCYKDMLNSIRFSPHKDINMIVHSPDDYILVAGEVVRRFEKEDMPNMYFVGVKFNHFMDENHHNMLNKLVKKLREDNS